MIVGPRRHATLDHRRRQTFFLRRQCLQIDRRSDCGRARGPTPPVAPLTLLRPRHARVAVLKVRIAALVTSTPATCSTWRINIERGRRCHRKLRVGLFPQVVLRPSRSPLLWQQRTASAPLASDAAGDSNPSWTEAGLLTFASTAVLPRLGPQPGPDLTRSPTRGLRPARRGGPRSQRQPLQPRGPTFEPDP